MTKQRITSIVFFITSKKHIKNIKQLRPFLGTKKVVIVTDVPFLSSNSVYFLDSYEHIKSFHPAVVALFMAYPYEKRLWLIEYSLRNNIPCIGIEEVNQLSLNNGRVNHYFTPLDGLAAASGTEKIMLENIPVPYVQNIRVTGWGFFDEIMQKKEEIKKSVIVFFSPLQEIDIVSLETKEVREKLLNLVIKFIELGYSVSIKPHPMEPKNILEKQLQSLDIKKARILDDLNVTELLNQHEIIVNRGNSQICLEAVYMKKKLLIYPMGIKTIFDDCSNILLRQSELNEKLSLLNTEHYLDQMQKIKSDHIPYTGKTALKNIAGFIMNSRQLHIRDEKKALHLSLLYYICRKTDRAIALTRYFSKTEADSICRFYQKPYSPKRFVQVMLMFKTDLLIKFYLTKIYIDHLARTRCFRRFFICDLKWIDLPDKETVPYFWADTHKNFAKSYKSLNKETN